MRFRLGLGVGFGLGYYLGSKAGRERYEQINDMVRKVKRSETFETAADKAKDVVDLGVERTMDIVDSKIGDTDGSVGNDAPNGAMVPPPPPDDPFLRTTPPGL
ncbi:MAG: hypothetical protein H0U41_04225 [Actinobacteria bacterium]|nr:hypothetical protein [Actinomycetota bacterium]